MLHYITKTALDQLVAVGRAHDCAEGYGNYVVAVQSKDSDGRFLVNLERWHDTEYWADRMAESYRRMGSHAEVWYVMDDETFNVDEVWNPERSCGRDYQLIYEDGDGKVLSSYLVDNFFSAVKAAQVLVSCDANVQVAVIKDYSTGMVFRVDKSLCHDAMLWEKFCQEKRVVEIAIGALRQLRLDGELAVI